MTGPALHGGPVGPGLWRKRGSGLSGMGSTYPGFWARPQPAGLTVSSRPKLVLAGCEDGMLGTSLWAPHCRCFLPTVLPLTLGKKILKIVSRGKGCFIGSGHWSRGGGGVCCWEGGKEGACFSGRK